MKSKRPRWRGLSWLLVLACTGGGVVRADPPIGGPFVSDIAPFTGIVQIPDRSPVLNEHCVIAILNRVAQVRPDGTWLIQNVPTNFGPIRARATCVENGITHSGQSELFTVPLNGVVRVGEVSFEAIEPIPVTLRVSAPVMTLTSAGATVALVVTAVYGDGTTRDVSADPAVSYRSSNPNIASVDANGVVTAQASGPVLMTVLREGLSAFARLTVSLSNTDSDGDGIPDDIEVANNLDPNNPIDALEDPDGDQLTNKQELVDFGTDQNLADSDGDSLSDREEVFAGSDGFVTNPRLADSDGDGVRDALEIQTGSDPTNPNSLNLAAALQSLELQPAMITLTVNTIIGEASQQLLAIGKLRDGTTIDLTVRGTNYLSSNLTICNFGAEPGRVFAGMDGMCTVTASHSGFTAPTAVTVRSFAPTALGFVSIPGAANNVDVDGTLAYVAAGEAGLQVVDASNPMQPVIVGAVDTAGNANDVQLAGSLAYVADGAAGLQIVDVQVPSTPQLRGRLQAPGIAQGVVVRGTLVFVAAGDAGLQVIDVTAADAPVLIGAVNTPGNAKGVDVEGALAVVADDASGIQVVDVADPTQPLIRSGLATGGQAKDVALQGDIVYVADFVRSLTLVNVSNPVSPALGPSTPSATGGFLNDVAVVGRFALGADVLFVNGVPIVDVGNPAVPIPRAILNFAAFRDDNGIGIAADASFVYLTASRNLTDNAATGDTRLYIGQYLSLVDNAGRAPMVQVVAPLAGATLLEGETVLLRVEASDDVAVVEVRFTVNGAVVATDSGAPYQRTFTVPAGGTTLTFGADATDPGNNRGMASPVVVNVVPDPRTTVVGQVVDLVGQPAPDIAVTCVGVSGATGSDGRFTLVGVPTVKGNIVCTAAFVGAQAIVRGTSASVAPVPSGTTDVGVIRQPASISSGGEVDRWQFVANRGEVITLNMTRVSDQANGSARLDPVLELRDSRGVLVGRDDESGSATPSGPGRNALIANLTLPATDTYTVIASGAGGTAGPYLLTLTPSTLALRR